jgi:hypothetical protein
VEKTEKLMNTIAGSAYSETTACFSFYNIERLASLPRKRRRDRATGYTPGVRSVADPTSDARLMFSVMTSCAMSAYLQGLPPHVLAWSDA